MTKSAITLFMSLSSFVLTSAGQTNKPLDEYPTVRPTQETIVVSDVAKSDIIYFIKSENGNPIYELRCHARGFKGDPDFDYSGDFECRLTSIGSIDQYSNLLTEDPHQSRDWESRGRFFASDVQDPCAKIANFGAVRDFKLRGMIVTLQIIDPKFDKGTILKSLKLRVTVKQDTSAQTPIAEAVPVPNGVDSAGCRSNEHFVNIK